jgi:hypothetical protein
MRYNIQSSVVIHWFCQIMYEYKNIIRTMHANCCRKLFKICNLKGVYCDNIVTVQQTFCQISNLHKF